MKGFFPSQMQTLLVVFFFSPPFPICFAAFGPSIFVPAVLKIAQELGKTVFLDGFLHREKLGESRCLFAALAPARCWSHLSPIARHPLQRDSVHTLTFPPLQVPPKRE